MMSSELKPMPTHSKMSEETSVQFGKTSEKSADNLLELQQQLEEILGKAVELRKTAQNGIF